MKNILIALSLLIGGLVVRSFGQDTLSGGGWNVDIVTGTAATISTTRVKVRAIILSSGTITSVGDYAVAYSTFPSEVNNGAQAGLFGGHLFASTAAITPAIVYRTTTTTSGNLDLLNASWKLGDCDNCYLDVPGLYIRQSAASSGEAFRAAVYWKR